MNNITGHQDNPTAKPQLGSPNPSKIKSIALFSYDDQDALAVVRILGAAKLANIQILRGYNFEDHQVHLEVIEAADLVIIQREFCRDYAAYTKLTALARTQQKPIVIDLDDNLFALPPDHPDRLSGYYVRSLLPTLQAVMDADLVTVTTKSLKDFLLPYNTNIQVIPNYLDDTLWKLLPPVPHPPEADSLIIGYMAGNTHQPDLQMVAPVLLDLLEKYPGRIRFHFWGIEAPSELAPHTQVDWYPPVFFRYDEFVNAFQGQHADIMIAPLCDNFFNSCKSSIKFLEYAANGIPGIYSRVTPYTDIVEHGKDGLLASTPDDWMDGLTRLVEDPILRQELAANALRKTRLHWLLSKNYIKRVKIHEDLAANYHPKAEPDHYFYQIEKSFAEQYYEEQQRTERKYNPILAELAAKNQDMVSLNEQLAFRTLEVAKKDEYIEMIHQQLADKDVTIASLNQLITERDEKTRLLYENIRAINTDLASKDETITSLIQQISDRDQHIQTIISDMDGKDETINSLNQQVAERDKNIQTIITELSGKNDTLTTLNQQLGNKDQKINQLEDELVSYVNSHSWRITRPLRFFGKIAKRIRHAS